MAALQPVWEQMEPYFRLRQVKTYEKFIDLRLFSVYNDYYCQLKGKLDNAVPLADRLVFALPPRLSYYLVHIYKWWLQRKSHDISFTTVRTATSSERG